MLWADLLLAFTYPGYPRSTCRAGPLSCWPTVLKGYLPWIADLPFRPALETIGFHGCLQIQDRPILTRGDEKAQGESGGIIERLAIAIAARLPG